MKSQISWTNPAPVMKSNSPWWNRNLADEIPDQLNKPQSRDEIKFPVMKLAT